jgi:hypothetical protein
MESKSASRMTNIRGRPIQVRWSSQRELMIALYPAKFGRVPISANQTQENVDAFVNDGHFLIRDELSALLMICKNFKVFICYRFYLYNRFNSILNQDFLFSKDRRPPF